MAARSDSHGTRPWAVCASAADQRVALGARGSQPELGLSCPLAGAMSLARAPAAQAQGAMAMTAAAPHLLLCGEDEDSPLGLSCFGPWQAQ